MNLPDEYELFSVPKISPDTPTNMPPETTRSQCTEDWIKDRGDEIHICENDECADESYNGYMYDMFMPDNRNVGGSGWGCDSEIYFMERIPPTLAHLPPNTRKALLECDEFREQYGFAESALEKIMRSDVPDLRDERGKNAYVVCGLDGAESCIFRCCDQDYGLYQNYINAHFHKDSDSKRRLCGRDYRVMELLPHVETEELEQVRDEMRPSLKEDSKKDILSQSVPEDPCRACMMDPAHTILDTTSQDCENKFFWLLDNGDYDRYFQNELDYTTGCKMICLTDGKLKDTEYKLLLIPAFRSQCLRKRVGLI